MISVSRNFYRGKSIEDKIKELKGLYPNRKDPIDKEVRAVLNTLLWEIKHS